MITDPPFWEEVQRKSPNSPFGGSAISILLPVLLGKAGEQQQGSSGTNEPFGSEENNKTPKPLSSSSSVKEPMDLSETSDLTLRLLQHVMMYMTPMDHVRYNVPAMSVSWTSSCVIEDETNRVVTYGAVAPPAVSNKTKYKSCLCGDAYVALLTAQGDAFVAGQTDTAPGTQVPQDPHVLRGVASRVAQLAGQGSKMLALTTAHTVRPISVIPANTKTIIPYRLCKYLTCALTDDSYMVGVDNVLYKTSTSQRAVGTPRRVMTMSRLGVSRVASGAGFIFVIDLSGRLYSLGKNKRGQLGNGKKQDSMRKPFLHTNLFHHFFVQVAAGDHHAVALASNGDVYGSGTNDHGQLGLGTDTREVLEMTKIPLPAPCVGIAAGPSATLFACSDGHVYGCGYNESGLLGLDHKSRQSKAVYTPQKMEGIEHGVSTMVLEFGSATTAPKETVAVEPIREIKQKKDSGCCKCCTVQ